MKPSSAVHHSAAVRTGLVWFGWRGDEALDSLPLSLIHFLSLNIALEVRGT